MMPFAPNTPPCTGRIRRRNAPAWLGCVLFVLVGSLLAPGCSEERRSIELQRVPMPEGGSVYTVAVLDDEEQVNIVAPSHAGLFIHHDDRGSWERIRLRPRHALAERKPSTRGASESAEVLTPSRRAMNFRPSELFSAHDARLWIAPGVSETGPQQLLVSTDTGHSWTPVALPSLTPDTQPLAGAPTNPEDTPIEDPDTDSPSASLPNSPQLDATDSTDAVDSANTTDTDSAPKPDPEPNSNTQDSSPAPRITPNPAHLRFVNAGDLGFYLMGASHLWKLNIDRKQSIPADAQPDKIWENISLEGAEFDNDTNLTKLPRVLRHYLPAGPDRPFELLTMLRDRLYVYRRDADQEVFQEVSVLEGADLQFATIPGSNIVLILTSEGLFRSEDAGESWTRLTWYALSQDETHGVAMQVLAPTDEQPATLLVALETGAVYRSDDLGESFTEVRPPDVDQRGVIDFGYSSRKGRVWAATRGAGVLRSLDRGKTWQPLNDELRATRATDTGADNSDGFLLGTDAGLYRLSGKPQNGHWQMLQPRATTAIRVERDSGAILSGTTSGAIVRLETNGKSTVSQAVPAEPSDAIAFRARRFRGVDLPDPSVVAIEAHSNNPQVYAWSAQRGPVVSLDAGVSWTPLTLNPAFKNALTGSYISNFTTEVGNRIYLVTRGLTDAESTQLWRSYNNGETWHAVSSFRHGSQPSDVFLAHNANLAPENIFMAHRNRFARSLDGGSSWRDLNGPWNDGEILLYELIGEKHLLIVENYQATHLVDVTDTEQEHPEFHSYPLNWPFQKGVNRAEIHNLSVQSGYLFLSTDRGLFTGKMPNNHQRLPNGLAILATLISVASLILVGFGVMRVTA